MKECPILVALGYFGNYLITNGVFAIKHSPVPDFLEKISKEEFVQARYVLGAQEKLMGNNQLARKGGVKMNTVHYGQIVTPQRILSASILRLSYNDRDRKKNNRPMAISFRLGNAHSGHHVDA
jgi:hypothetical protein